jgi:hypothetical protein
VSKAGAYPNGTSFQVAPGLTQKHYTRLENIPGDNALAYFKNSYLPTNIRLGWKNLARDKRSGLLRKFENYERKKVL